MCQCNINAFITVNRKDNNDDINKHMYEHVMAFYIPSVCCDIVKSYVGNNPYNKMPVYKQLDTYSVGIIMKQYSTLGYVDFSEGFKENEQIRHGICTIKECDSHTNWNDIYCDNHYDYWMNMIITHYHSHYCDICKNRICFGHEQPRCESYCYDCEIDY